MSTFKTLAAVLLATSGLANVHAATLPGDGSWAGFTVDGNLPPYSLGWIDDAAAPLAFSFDIAAGYVGTFTVVDAGFSGDAFVVSDNGTALGSTSTPVAGDPAGAIEFDYDAALANGNFSRGVYTLGAGSHSVTGSMSLSLADAFGPLNSTIGGVRLEVTSLVSQVPEPTSLALLAVGLGLIGASIRRRTR